MAGTTSSETLDAVQVYSWPARAMHWLVVVLVILMFATGNVMTDRGEAGVWDATTNALYSTHKLIGFAILWLILLRLAYRLIAGAPPLPPTISPWQALASGAAHWGLYALLIAMPITGWLGVSLFGARDVFGLFALPEIVAVDKEASEFVFEIHELIANAIFALVAVHVAAALYHAIVLRDGVFQRMWPRRR
jgi:cytochrome b561